jgi:hypothetical protein
MICGKKRSKNDRQFVKVFMTNPDLLYQDSFEQPRLGPNALKIAVTSVFKETYGYDMEVT